MKIAAGGDHSLTIDSNGIVYGFGKNTEQQLSQGMDELNVNCQKVILLGATPITKNIGGKRVTHIAAGKNFSIYATINASGF